MAAQANNIENFRVKLLSLAQDNDPYPFLSFVDDYLTVVPQDDQIRALAVALSLRKGLVSIAMEKSDACPPDTKKSVELKEAVQKCKQMQAETREWSTTKQVFQANLNALRTKNTQRAALAQQLEHEWNAIVPELTLHQVNDGNRLVRGTRSDGQRIWIPAALDFCNTIEAVDETPNWKNLLVPPFLIDGSGLGYLVPRLYTATFHTYLNYSPAIYIVEPNIRGLALALNLNDWTEALQDDRVYLFVGPNAWTEWQQFLCDNPSLPSAQSITTLTRWPGMPQSPAQQAVEAVEQARATQRDNYQNRAKQAYTHCDAAFWANRYHAAEHDTADNDGPLRVMAITSRFTTFLQHSTRDLLAAFERAGMQTRLLIEQNDHTTLPIHAYLECIIEFRPDLIVVLDHHRYEYKQRFINNIPFVCWIQDDLRTLFNPKVGPELKGYDFTIGYGMTQCVLQHGYPAERFMPCKLAIEPSKFAPTGDDESRFRCDIAYISHHGETPEQLHQRIRQMEMGDEMRRLIDGYYEQTRDLFNSPRFNGAYDIDAIISDTERQVGLELREESRFELSSLYFRPLADRSLRHATLHWIADWADTRGRELRLYGRDWEKHPRFSKYAKGVAAHGGELAAISRNAAINIHTGLNTAVHQRVLETLCAGGFLLIRNHPFDFYEPGHATFDRFIAERQITQPTSIPMSEFPADYIELRRRRAEITGRGMTDSVEITQEMILEAQARAFDPERYHYANIAFPGFDQVVFDGPESFAERADHFIANPDERESLVQAMQHTVNELFTYDALVPRVINFLKQKLADPRM